MPRVWLERNKLNKGDLIFLNENSNNELILSPEIKKEKEEIREITINIENKGEKAIKREITAAYINNFNIIKVIGKDLQEKAKIIREGIHNHIALEIMEQTKTSIVTRDFLDMEKISIKNLIRRMDIILRDMLIDSKLTFKKDLFKNIYHRDEDLNRLTFLIFRATKYALNNHSVAESFKLTPIDLLNYWSVANCLENIGDEAKRITRFLRVTKLNEKEKKELIDIYSRVEQHYLDTLSAYYNEDKPLSFKLVDK